MRDEAAAGTLVAIRGTKRIPKRRTIFSTAGRRVRSTNAQFILLVDEETTMKRNLVVPLTLAAAVACLFFFQVEIVESHSLRSSASPGSDASNNPESNHWSNRQSPASSRDDISSADQVEKLALRV